MITVAEELSGHHPISHVQSSRESQNPRAKAHGRAFTRPNLLNSQVEGAFVGDTDPALIIEHEKPWHRLAIEYTLQGLSIQEICDLMGHSPSTVSRVLKQPWARERLAARAQMTTMDKVKEWLENECIPNLEVIKQVRDTAARPADRKGAAEYLTDRFLGKAVQPVSESSVPATELTKDEIERRLAKLAEGVEAT